MNNYPKIGLDNARAHLADVLFPAYARFSAATKADLGLALLGW